MIRGKNQIENTLLVGQRASTEPQSLTQKFL